MSLSVDFETRSLVDLPSTGVYPYAQHPSTDIWMMAWAFGDMDEPELWLRGEPCPQRVADHVLVGGEIRAHNAQFERIMWKYVAAPKYGFPQVADDQWVCSAAEAAAMSLPRSLGELARVTGVAVQKDSDGHNLMMRMCRPRSFLDDGTPVWWDVPDRIRRLGEYCIIDVKTERAVSRVLRRLTPKEREIYLLDQRVNDTGIYLDRPLILAAKEIASEGIDRANKLLSELTSGVVTGVTKVAQMKAWIESQGVAATSLAKAPLKELLDGDLPTKVRSVLETRASAGRTSIAKLDSMINCVCDDGFVRGLFLYHAAGTGRWGGRLIQTQNFPRGEIENIESFIPAVMDRNYEFIEMMASPVTVVSSMLRSMLTARPGRELIAADYSAIEARVLNWVAGQDDVTRLFADGSDVYRVNAAKLYGIPLDQVLKFPHRQTGKFQELGCGFGMGHKKAVSAAKSTYGLELSEEFAKEVVKSYRDSHPMVTAFWNESNDAVIDAVLHPGRPVVFGALHNLKALRLQDYLYIKLPSGRPLVYPAPVVVDAETPWGEMRPAVEFSGTNGVTRQWERSRLYGGLIVENIVQAIARDLMAEGMLRAEERGYTPILSSHDEVVVEVEPGFGSVEAFEELLCELPEWAQNCPLAAEGWRGTRYRK